MGEWTSSLRVRDGQALDAFYEAMLAAGEGRTVFIAGDDAAGRSALLRDWVDGLARPRPRVLGGTFVDGAYVPWEQDRASASEALAALERLLSVGEAVVSLSEFVLPAAISKLLGQIIAKSQAALTGFTS